MDKIEPLDDYQRIEQLSLGEEVVFMRERCRVFARATLATGEPGLVLQRGNEQFLVSFAQLIKGHALDNV
jgi:hypothetical protein